MKRSVICAVVVVVIASGVAVAQEAPGALPMDERQIDYFLDGEFEHEQRKGIFRRDNAVLKHIKDHFDMSYSSVAAPQVHAQLGVFNNPLEDNVRPLPQHGSRGGAHITPH